MFFSRDRVREMDCPECGRQSFTDIRYRMFASAKFIGPFGRLVSVGTLASWMMILHALGLISGQWRCVQCGSSPAPQNVGGAS